MKEEIRDKHIRLLTKLKVAMVKHMAALDGMDTGIVNTQNLQWVKEILAGLDTCNTYQTTVTIDDMKRCNNIYKLCH